MPKEQWQSANNYVVLCIGILLVFGALMVKWTGDFAMFYATVGFVMTFIFMLNADRSSWNPLADLHKEEAVANS